MVGVVRVVEIIPSVHVPPAILYAVKLLLTLDYTSPPNLFQIESKLPKFLIQGGFGVVGVG